MMDNDLLSCAELAAVHSEYDRYTSGITLTPEFNVDDLFVSQQERTRYCSDILPRRCSELIEKAANLEKIYDDERERFISHYPAVMRLVESLLDTEQRAVVAYTGRIGLNGVAIMMGVGVSPDVYSQDCQLWQRCLLRSPEDAEDLIAAYDPTILVDFDAIAA